MSPLAKAEPETILDPFVEEETRVKLERGAVLYLRTKESGRVAWDVRWPAPHEKDPVYGAGGWRAGIADNAKLAEAAGRAAFGEGPQGRKWA